MSDFSKGANSGADDSRKSGGAQKGGEQDTEEALEQIDGTELFIGLVGPLGTDLGAAREELRTTLGRMDYDVHVIRLADKVKKLPRLAQRFDLDPDPEQDFEDARIERLMGACDVLRDDHTADVLAQLAVIELNTVRKQWDSPRRAFILHSLKHPNEVNTLRKVYGDQFVCLSFYQPRADRIRNLKDRIKRSHHGSPGDWRLRAEGLIRRDQLDAGTKFGQNVGKCFPKADFFARANRENGELQADIARVIDLMFARPFATPTIDESMMFQASATALRSADLSRQVGAVIAGNRADILSTGCNEVPRPGGGVYYSADRPDRRDFQQKEDPNSILKRRTLEEIFCALKNAGWLASSHESKESSELVASAAKQKLLKGLHVDNLIEFGRVVHAEMNALMHAARVGRAVEGATLYCTTFPCHGCARHIIAAGIKKVMFVEPYPKSLVGELYPHAISVEGSSADTDAVKFEPFVGVAPRRFMRWFERGRRKNDLGYAVDWKPRTAKPIMANVFGSYLEKEHQICANLAELAIQVGIVLPVEGTTE